ncbi:MAG: hypothetical protein ACREQA_17485 [Candidatus Binatia bacterium]
MQTNKGRLAVELFDLIHSVDSLKLAQVLDRQGVSLVRIDTGIFGASAGVTGW